MCNNFSLLGARRNKAFQVHFLYLTIINACNIPQFLECKMQILFITVCDTSGTWIRKQLFYFISVITFQQISFTFQFGRENLDFLSISSPLTVSQQRALLVLSPSTAISYTKLHILTFITSEHAKSLVSTRICSPRLCRRPSRGMLADCHYLRSVPLPNSIAVRMRLAAFGHLPSLLLARVLFTGRGGCCVVERASQPRRALGLLPQQRQAVWAGWDGSSASCTSGYALIKLEKLELHCNPQKFSN